MIGKEIQHYRIGAKLGSGGMGEVYRAEDTRLGREVALKFLPASFRYDPDRRERFLREARAASALRSPNIASIYDIGEDADSVFIVMELVEGELLAERIRRGPVGVADTIEIALQLADALDEAGAKGIVHRDIKSSNIIVTERGLVKILDFGLAKIIERHSDSGDLTDEHAPTLALPTRETLAGALLGTVSYMSPEQAYGRPIDPRSDIFSAGVVVYEMLAGQLPFQGDSVTEIIDKILHAEPVALTRLNAAVPPDLDRIVRRAMAKDLDQRYQAARDFYLDLHTQRRGTGPVSTNSLTPTERLTLDSGVSRPLVSGEFDARVVNGVAVMTFANITQDVSDAWIGTGIAETVTADLKKVHGLSVFSRERVFEMLKHLGAAEASDSDEKFALEVGQRLGATWIVSGGFQRIGDMIRITARFLETAGGELVTSVKIDGRVTEIFDLQDKIVYELTSGLNIQLGDSEIVEIEQDETTSVEAYECYSRGLMNLRNASRESLDRAIFLLQKATEYDANYAAAWAALGAAYDLKASFLSLKDLAWRAIEFEKKAIELNPNSSRSWDWLGGAYLTLGMYDEAIEAVKKALAIDPNSTNAMQTLARAYWYGKGMIDEGIAEMEKVVARERQGGYAFLQLGLLYTLKGDYERAEAMCRKAIELQEAHISGKVGLLIVGARTRLGYVYYLQGRYSDAMREFELEHDFLQSTDHALRERALIELGQKIGAVKLKQGDREVADVWFNRAIKSYDERTASGAFDSSTAYYMSLVYALRGDNDRALKLLEDSMSDHRAFNVQRAHFDPDLDGLRDDPRFVELVRVEP